jgi:hypothetical protein
MPAYDNYYRAASSTPVISAIQGIQESLQRHTDRFLEEKQRERDYALKLQDVERQREEAIQRGLTERAAVEADQMFKMAQERGRSQEFQQSIGEEAKHNRALETYNAGILSNQQKETAHNIWRTSPTILRDIVDKVITDDNPIVRDAVKRFGSKDAFYEYMDYAFNGTGDGTIIDTLMITPDKFFDEYSNALQNSDAIKQFQINRQAYDQANTYLKDTLYLNSVTDKNPNDIVGTDPATGKPTLTAYQEMQNVLTNTGLDQYVDLVVYATKPPSKDAQYAQLAALQGNTSGRVERLKDEIVGKYTPSEIEGGKIDLDSLAATGQTIAERKANEEKIKKAKDKQESFGFLYMVEPKKVTNTTSQGQRNSIPWSVWADQEQDRIDREIAAQEYTQLSNALTNVGVFPEMLNKVIGYADQLGIKQEDYKDPDSLAKAMVSAYYKQQKTQSVPNKPQALPAGAKATAPVETGIKETQTTDVNQGILKNAPLSVKAIAYGIKAGAKLNRFDKKLHDLGWKTYNDAYFGAQKMTQDAYNALYYGVVDNTKLPTPEEVQALRKIMEQERLKK